MHKVLFLTNIPSPYRVSFFNELGKSVDLTVVFEKAKSDERDSSWSYFKALTFKPIFLKGIKVAPNKSLCLSSISYLKKNAKSFDYIFCCNYATPTGLLEIFYLKLKKIPYIIEGDGGFYNPKKRIRNSIKKHIFKNADYFFSTSTEFDKYLLMLGAAQEKIYRYSFSSVFDNEILNGPLNVNEILSIRNKNSIPNKKVVVSVGQFIERKGFDLLIKASDYFDESYVFYIIGGAPNKEYSDLIKSKKINNLILKPFMEKKKLFRFLSACDLFVLPTREDIWGLVVNEVMACGLPVVSTDRCISALEMINSRNGFVIETNSISAIVNSIKEFFSKDIKSFRYEALSTAHKFTIEQMVSDHLTFLNKN